MSNAVLADAIDRYTASQPGSNPYVTEIAGLTLVRADCTMPPMPLLYKPALCLVAQGAKRGTFGTTSVEYRAGQALVVGVEMPGIGRVTEASPGTPYVGAIVEFDLAVMRDVLAEIDVSPEPSYEIAGASSWPTSMEPSWIRCCDSYGSSIRRARSRRSPPQSCVS